MTPLLIFVDRTFNSIINILKPNVNTLLNWYRQNGLIANSGKSHFWTSPHERRSLKIHDSIIKASSSKETLGGLIDREFTFHNHITRLYSKANQKPFKYMALPKQRLLMSSYITSQFNYYPLVWMIHNRKLNKKINKVHKRTLRIVYGDHKTSFSELLNIDKSVTIHQRNLQDLLIEIYKWIANNNEWNFSIFLKILSMNLERVSIYQAETHVQFSSVLNP